MNEKVRLLGTALGGPVDMDEGDGSRPKQHKPSTPFGVGMAGVDGKAAGASPCETHSPANGAERLLVRFANPNVGGRGENGDAEAGKAHPGAGHAGGGRAHGHTGASGGRAGAGMAPPRSHKAGAGGAAGGGGGARSDRGATADGARALVGFADKGACPVARAAAGSAAPWARVRARCCQPWPLFARSLTRARPARRPRNRPHLEFAAVRPLRRGGGAQLAGPARHGQVRVSL